MRWRSGERNRQGSGKGRPITAPARAPRTLCCPKRAERRTLHHMGSLLPRCSASAAPCRRSAGAALLLLARGAEEAGVPRLLFAGW